MRVICEDEAKRIRDRFLKAFIDQKSDYFLKQIKNTDLDMCYQGYYWDCMKDKQLISEKDVDRVLSKSKDMIYLLCDLHGKNRYFNANRFEYPFGAVLELNYEEFKRIVGTLPEDFYIFDKAFEKCFSLTHEWFDDERFCLESSHRETL